MTDYFLFSIFRAMNWLSPRRYTNNLFKVRQMFFRFALFFLFFLHFPSFRFIFIYFSLFFLISYFPQCFKRPMEEARGDSMKDYFLFSIFRVVSGAKPTEVV